MLNYALSLMNAMKEFNKKISEYLVTCESWNCYYFYQKDVKEINKISTCYKLEVLPNSNKKAYVIRHIPTGSILLYSYNTLVMIYIKTSEHCYFDIGYYSPTTREHQQEAINLYNIHYIKPTYIIDNTHKKGITNYGNNEFKDWIYNQNREIRNNCSYRLTPINPEGVICSTQERQFIYYNPVINLYYYIDIDTLEPVYKSGTFKVPDKKIIQQHHQEHPNKYIDLNMMYSSITQLKYILSYEYSTDALQEILNNLEDPTQTDIKTLLITYLKHNKITEYFKDGLRERIKESTFLDVWEVMKYAID